MPNTSFSSPHRRRKNRYVHGNLRVTVLQSRWGGLWRHSQLVTWTDFNSLGIAFSSEEKQFHVGDTVQINLAIDDKQSATLDHVVGIVRNVTAYNHTYRYGIEFDFNANQYMRSAYVQQQLEFIEQILAAIFLRLP